MEIKKDWKYNDTVTEHDLNRIEKNIEENHTKKVQKIEGKGLSENDFTNEYKKKLDELENYDDSAIKSEIKNMRIGAIGGGKNLFDARKFCEENPEYYTYSGNGCIYIVAEDTRSTGFISAIKLDAGTYTISGYGNSVKLWNGSSFIESETFTLTRTTFLFPKFLGTGKKIYPQIEIGSTATDFEEFIHSNKMNGEGISEINEKLSNSMIIDMVLGGSDTNAYLPMHDESMQAIISKEYIKVTPNTKYRIKRDGLDYSTNITIKCIGYSDIDVPITDGVEVFLNDNCGLIQSTPNIGWIEFKTTPTTEYISVGVTVNDTTRRPTLECLGAGQALIENTKLIGNLHGELANKRSHNIPRLIPKDITKYYSDGTLWKRLNGTDRFELFEDIYVGDYIKMSRPISAYNQIQDYQATGSQYVTIAGIDTLWGNGDNISMAYHHLVMVPGMGFGGTQHFGKSRMNPSNTTDGGYAGSEMFTTTLGDIATSGSTESTATINQQLYAEFGSHLKTTRELLSKSINPTGYNKFGEATGCSNEWDWCNCQAVLMSEVELYGSIAFSSSGFDTGNANKQLPLFMFVKQAINNRSAWYWLKDIASASYFCICRNNGYSSYNSAGVASFYVRPRFVIAA